MSTTSISYGITFTKILVNGKQYISSSKLFSFESLADLLNIRITECGSENVYFDFQDDDGEQHNGFCKCL